MRVLDSPVASMSRLYDQPLARSRLMASRRCWPTSRMASLRALNQSPTALTISTSSSIFARRLDSAAIAARISGESSPAFQPEHRRGGTGSFQTVLCSELVEAHRGRPGSCGAGRVRDGDRYGPCGSLRGEGSVRAAVLGRVAVSGLRVKVAGVGPC